MLFLLNPGLPHQEAKVRDEQETQERTAAVCEREIVERSS